MTSLAVTDDLFFTRTGMDPNRVESLVGELLQAAMRSDERTSATELVAASQEPPARGRLRVWRNGEAMRRQGASVERERDSRAFGLSIVTDHHSGFVVQSESALHGIVIRKRALVVIAVDGSQSLTDMVRRD